MKPSQRTIAAWLAALILVQTLPLSAMAQEARPRQGYDDEEAQVCWSEGSPRTGLEARIFDAGGDHDHYRPEDVPALLGDYLDAKSIHDEFLAATVASRILQAVFSEPGSPGYEAALQEIDGAMGRNPDAIFDLAKSLQLHWEARYALGVGRERQAHVMTGAEIGVIIGIIAAVATSWRNPRNVPKMLQIARALYPVVGGAAGAGTGYGVFRARMAMHDVPPAPAHFMRLGLDNDSVDFDNQHLMETVGSMLAGTVAFSGAIALGTYALTAIDALAWINRAGTIFKVNPVVLVASIVISLVVEKGVASGIRYMQYRSLRSDVYAARDLITEGQRTGDDRKVFGGADALVRASLTLAAWLSQPITKELVDYSQDISGWEHEYGRDNPVFQSKLRDRTRELSDKITEVVRESGFRHDADYEGYVVRGFLRERNTEALRDLEPMARHRGQAYLEVFDEWLEAYENEHQTSAGGATRLRLFRDYLDDLDHAKDVQVSNELVNSQVRKQASHVLLQAMALLRTTGKVYVEPHIDFLMSTIANNDLVTRAALDGRLFDPTQEDGMP